MLADIGVSICLAILIFLVSYSNREDMTTFLDTKNEPKIRAKGIMNVMTGLPLYYGLIFLFVQMLMKIGKS